MKPIKSKRYAKFQRKKTPSASLRPLLERSINKKTAIAAAVLTLISGIIYAFLFSDYFRIKSIKIAGNQSIEESKVKEAVESGLSEKIYGWIPKNNLFLISAKEISKKVKDGFQEAESVEVSKIFPGEISIAIKEKNPALIWCRENCYFINDQGMAFLSAGEKEIDSQKRKFIKVIEETVIPEETEEERQLAAPEQNAGELSADKDSEQQGNVLNTEKDTESENKNNDGDNKPEDNPQDSGSGIANAKQNVPEESTQKKLSAISLNDQVSDENFVKFTLDINDKINYNSKLKIIYYKTKGTKTRELIAFTDKNTRLYFDTTKDSRKQADNLGYLLERSKEKDKADNLKYIYLKNEDRVFYK